MRAEEMRVEIAKSDGWTSVNYEWCGTGKDSRRILCGDKVGSFTRIVPDYPNDLNAMHEAEKMLDDSQWHCYASYIGRHDTKKLLHASAQWKAECFLRTLGRYQPTGGEKL